MTIKRPPVDKIYNLILSTPQRGLCTDLARQAIISHYTDLSEDEVVEHIDKCKSKLEEFFLNSTNNGVKFKVLNECPLSIQIFHNNTYKFLKYFERLDGKKLEKILGILLERLDFYNIEINSNGRNADSLCLDIQANYKKSFIEGYAFIQAKWKQDSNSQINLTDLRNFVGGISCLKHTKFNSNGKFFTHTLIYITSATFSEEAKDFAQNMGIICINGVTLADLLIKYQLTRLVKNVF